MTTGLDRLLPGPAALLDTTMDQLRTLIVVHETGTALAASRRLGREQSSVQKQLDTLNRNFGTLCGEPLVLKRGRGQDVRFTDTGEALVELARRTLDGWLDGIEASRRGVGKTLAVGTTRFTLGYLAHAGEQVAREFRERGVELRIDHVRTRDLLPRLRGGEADLVCGSVLARAGDGGPEDCDVMEWRRSGLTLLTNLPVRRLPGAEIAVRDLRGLPLVVPSSGLITDFLRDWFGEDYRDRLDIPTEIDTVGYGFQLLRSGLLSGGMLVTRGIGEAVADGRLPEGAGLRAVAVVDDSPGPALEVLVGAFARRGERARYGEGHPLNLLWEALAHPSPHPPPHP